MCGIAGYVSPENTAAAMEGVERMLASMARRGPDSAGEEHWPGAALGHRRLAILDLSEAGRQPMLSDDGRIGLVFNGCIYNFQELRGELEQRGHRFHSQCDTEVLLRGYQEWGIDRLTPRLRGMFAFGIWDQPRRTLTLVRDRLGVKPLVYGERNGAIAFASTVRALREAGFGGDIDSQAVLDVLEYGWVSEERSIYAGICKLPPATIMEWRDGSVTQRRYWDLPPAGARQPIGFEEAVEKTESLLLESVRLRLISDVPIGALLSGGIDSALVCWAMRESNADLIAYTVRVPNDPSDESGDAARTARLLGVRHEIVDLPVAEPTIDEALDAYSEPFAVSSAHGLLRVSQAVKQCATVLLTGDGGDDVFLGYPFFRHAWMAQKLARRLPDLAAPLWLAARRFIPAQGTARRAGNFINYATGGLALYAQAHDGLPYYESRAMLGPRLASRRLAQRQMAPSMASARRLLAEVFEHHRKLEFTCEFMQKVDGGTMHYALEARSPFLDHRLWEFAAVLAPEVRLRGGALKAVLREIARRRVGEEVAARRKQGFTVPVERWLAHRWKGALDGLREGSTLEREGWLRRGSLRNPVDAALREGRTPIQLWRLLMLNAWLEREQAASSRRRGDEAPSGFYVGIGASEKKPRNS